MIAAAIHHHRHHTRLISRRIHDHCHYRRRPARRPPVPATRLRLDDMLPIAAQLDDVGYGSLECQRRHFDARIRFLGEDLQAAPARTRSAGRQDPRDAAARLVNLLGYRHYADDVVERFVERGKTAWTYPRLDASERPAQYESAALQAVRSHGAHAQ